MTFAAGAATALPVIVVGFVAAAILAWLLTPIVGTYVQRRGILDRPDARRVHRRPLPRGGGVAVVAAFAIIGGGLAILGSSVPGMPQPRGVAPSQVVGLFVGGLVAAALGALDDLLDLRARWQLLGQLIAAGVAVTFGIVVTQMSNPFGPGNLVFPNPLPVVLTVVWIVGMINSINFIDGLDGLSSGISLIAAVTLGVLSLTVTVGQPWVAVVCFVLAGALLGFLRWNFHPAVIFQGTAGVMFLGYTLGALSIIGATKVVVALLVLGVPIIDSFWVIVRRLSGRRSPFSPDRGHIHHRLLGLGLSHRATVVLIYAICGTLGVMSLIVSEEGGLYTFLGAAVALGLVVFFLAREPREALEPTSYEDRPGS